MNFTLNNEDISAVPYYTQQLREIQETEEYVLNIDCEHLYSIAQGLYTKLINFPSEMIPYFDEVATNFYKEIIHDPNSPAIIQVRPVNLKETSLQRNLGPDDIDKLV